LQPKLADDLPTHHRYDAVCAAALAGCGQGKDDPPLDDTARSRWRKQAIDWLKADLIAWSKILESGPRQARPTIAETLEHWKAVPDLAGLRDPASLDKLPKDEQDACRVLWKDVDALLAKAGAGSKP
jgi:serine/threonine-protein kinase